MMQAMKQNYFLYLLSVIALVGSYSASAQCVAHAGNDATICLGQSVTLGDSPTASGGVAPYSYDWSGNSTAIDAANPVVAPTATETFIVTITDAIGCVTTDAVTITVNPLPSASAGPDLEKCLNSPSVVLPAGGTWSGSSLVTAAGVFTPSTVGTYTLTRTVTALGCPNSDQMVMTVLGLPTVNAGSDINICIGQTAQLSASATSPNGNITLYTWSGGSVSNSLSSTPTTSPTNTTTYNVTAVDVKSCNKADQVTVFVNPLPTVNAGPDITVCNTPSPVTLTGFSPAGGTWTGSGVTANGDFTSPGVGTYTLTYSYTSASGCINTDTRVITVSASQVVDAGADYQVCLNAPTLQLQPITAGGTWSGSALVSSTGSFTPTTTGVYTLTYTIASGACSGTDQVSVSVFERPVVNAGIDAQVCTGSSYQLQGSVSGGTSPYTYTWAPAATLSATNIVNPVASPTASTTYILTSIDTHGCSGTDNVLITLKTLPSVNAGPDITLCDQPVVAQLGNFAPAGGTWAGTGVTSNGNFTPTAVGDFNLTYTVVGTNGCSNSDSRIVHVISSDVIDAGSDVYICLGNAPIQLQGVTPDGTWSGTGLVTPAGVFTPSTLGDYSITYTVNGALCTLTDQKVVHVTSAPTLNMGTEPLVCAGQSAPLSATVNGGTSPYASYSWVDQSGNAVASSLTASVSPSSTTLYTLSVTDNAGCVVSGSKAVMINPLPTVNAGADESTCNVPTPFLLSGFSPAGGTWSGNGVSPTGVFTPSGLGQYTLTYSYTASTGCVGSDTKIVSVVDPSSIDAGPDRSVCGNAEAISVADLSSATGVWTGSGITNANGTFDPNVVGVGTYTLTLTVGSGACQISDQLHVTVLNAPTVSAGNDEVFCEGFGQALLTGCSPAGGVWTGTGIISSNGVYDESASAFGTHVLTYSYTDSNTGCIAQDTKSVIVSQKPQVNFTLDPISCVGSEVGVVNNSTGATQYRWTFTHDGYHLDIFTFQPSYVFDEETVGGVSLFASNNNGCADSLYQDTQVIQAPVVNMTADVDHGCSPLAVHFNNTSHGDLLSFEWDFGTSTSFLQNPGVQTFTANGTAQSYAIELTASNVCGISSMVRTINVDPLPAAAFDFNFLSTQCSPVSVQFNDLSQGNPQSSNWNFDGGQMQSNATEVVGFTTTGAAHTFNVQLTVTNACGSNTATHPVTVLPNNVQASFSVNAMTGCEPFDLQVTNGAQNATSVHYTLAPAIASANPNPTYTYDIHGNYSVYQYATDGCGFDTTMKVIQVLPSPTVQISASDSYACEESNVQFHAMSDAVSLDWNMGDGTTSNSQDVTHSFTGEDIYTVTLVGHGLNQCTSTATLDFPVHHNPQAMFTVDQDVTCSPMQACLQNTTVGGETYHWQLGWDGETMEFSPCHIFTNGTDAPVIEHIVLEARTSFGCVGTYIHDLTVNPVPSGYFELSDYSSCSYPVTVTSSIIVL
jgi:large repetitive protein